MGGSEDQGSGSRGALIVRAAGVSAIFEENSTEAEEKRSARDQRVREIQRLSVVKGRRCPRKVEPRAQCKDEAGNAFAEEVPIIVTIPFRFRSASNRILSRLLLAFFLHRFQLNIAPSLSHSFPFLMLRGNPASRRAIQIYTNLIVAD